MTFRRMLTAALVAASALVVAPIADADPGPPVVMIKSATVSTDVWDQSDWSGYPVIAYPEHGGSNQWWALNYDNTIQEQRDGLCATAEGDRVVGRPCNGSYPQKWRGIGAGEPYMIKNLATGTCVTHDGSGRQLVLRECDEARLDQRWYLRG